MKLVHIEYHFEFSENMEEILDKHGIENYVRFPRIEGKDRDGKHFGSKVHPGNSAVIQAQVPEDKIESLLKDLKGFKEEKESHRHLQALVLPIEDRVE